MIKKPILLVVIAYIGGCHPFGIDPLSSVQSKRDSLLHLYTASNTRSSMTLFETRKMEIWWDARDENLEPPTILHDESRSSPDRMILTTGNNDSRKHHDVDAEIFEVDGNKLKNANDKSVAGTIVRLKDSSGQEQALSVLGSVEWVLVEVDGSYEESSWQMIPAENLIAAAQSTGTKLAFAVSKSADVAGLSKALELGVDALCISTKNGAEDPNLWKTAFEAREQRNLEAEKESEALSSDTKKSKMEPEIVIGSCWRRDTRGTVLADRICVDLVQKLRPEEGCWVGSSAKIMALVLSEAASSQFVPTRPFRVNAGPVHSYILLGDGITTKYLCELQPSDQVMVYNTKLNSSKPVAIGRLKEEIRPCILVELETRPDDDNIGESLGPTGQVFLQQAETVRLGQTSGKFVRITDLEAQGGGNTESVQRESILLRIMKTGTHVGKVYTGKVEER